MTGLPPFKSVLKNRDVEDPVNLWMHRPLAYGLVAAIFRTPITPNQITIFATLVGIFAGVCFILGSPTLMVVGGIMLWSAAILDGADGILARAKKLQSDLGRAIDGSADMLVAIATVLAAVYHLWVTHHNPLHMLLAVVAIVTAVAQIYMYDYYKESYSHHTDPNWNGKTESLETVQARLTELENSGNATYAALFATRTYVRMLTIQSWLVAMTNPRGTRVDRSINVTDETIRQFRWRNYVPMQLWTLVSLCPHTYVMAICAMFDRVDIYLWYRVLGGNAIWMAAIVWQRLATEQTLRDFQELGVHPQEAEPTEQPEGASQVITG